MTSTTSRLDTQYTTPAPQGKPLPPNQVGFYDALGSGFSVVPGMPRTKRTYIKWRPYQERRAAPQEVAEWLRRWPDANPLVITGLVSGVIVLDMDGIEAFAALRARGWPPPTAMTAVTRSPGGPYREHYWYRSTPKGWGGSRGSRAATQATRCPA